MTFAALDQPQESLVSLGWALAQPPWPENAAAAADFALTFLQANQMFRGSGHLHCDLAVRLRRVPLSPHQILHCDAILRRAVSGGAGLAGFRNHCRITRHARPAGLHDWLKPQALQAVGECLRFWRKVNGQWSDPVEKRNLNAWRMLRAMQVR